MTRREFSVRHYQHFAEASMSLPKLGRYQLFVSPGTYNLIAWNEGVQSEPRAVTIPDGGVAEEDFVLR